MRISREKQLKSLNIQLRTVASFLLIVFFISGIYDIFNGSTNSDLTNNFYFGLRFWQKELIWDKEFHDKLPFVQILFSISSLFSIKIWNSFSYLLQIIASYYLYKGIKALLKEIEFKDKYFLLDDNIARITGLIYLIFPLFLPGGFIHISNIATNFFTISLFNLIKSRNHYQLKRFDKNLKVFLFPAFFLAMAISIRPYFFLSSILIGIWFTIQKNTKFSDKNSKYNSKLIFNFIFIFQWLSLILFFGILINYTPYLILNKNSTFFDGLYLLSQNINPQPFNKIIISQLEDIFRILKFSFLPIFILINILTKIPRKILVKTLLKTLKKIKIDFIFFVLILPISIELTILKKHYWDLYIVMFTPFITIFLSYLIKLLFYFYLKLNIKRKDIIALIAISFFSGLYIPLKIGYKNFISNRKDKTDEIIEVLRTKDSKVNKKFNFYDLTSMQLHLKANHTRYGLPHASHIKHLELNKYKNNKLDIPQSLVKKFPLNPQKLSELISENENIKIIIAKENTKIYRLLSKNKKFRISTKDKKIKRLTKRNIRILERI